MESAVRMESAERVRMSGTGERVVTWHTMECPYSWTAEQAAQYLIDEGNEATIVYHPISGVVVQILPGDTGAQTLRVTDPRTGQRGVTNGHGTFHAQVEVVGYAKSPWTDDMTHAGAAGLHNLMEFFRANGVPDRWATGTPPATFPGPGVERTMPVPGKSGHSHHGEWRFNNHGDPGAIAAPWVAETGVTVANRSFNGWITIGIEDCVSFLAPGGKTVYVNGREGTPEAAVLLEAWARAWHEEVEPIAVSHESNREWPNERNGYYVDSKGRKRWDAVGIHAFRPYQEEGEEVGTGNLSNHRSASGMDINGHRHHYEPSCAAGKCDGSGVPHAYQDGFQQWQRDKIREIMRRWRADDGVIVGRTGLDFTNGRRDGMHVEFAPGTSREQIKQAAKRAEDYVGRSSVADVFWINAYGHDVAAVQTALKMFGYGITSIDGKAGPEFDRELREFQKDKGVTVDGRCGPQVRDAIANHVVKPKPEPLPTPEPTPEPEPEPAPEPDLSEFYVNGNDRFETFALTALEQFPDGAEVVYLAPGWEGTIDALAAAGYKDGPVLLVGNYRLTAETITAIRALKPSRVRAIGGRVPKAAVAEVLDIIKEK